MELKWPSLSSTDGHLYHYFKTTLSYANADLYWSLKKPGISESPFLRALIFVLHRIRQYYQIQDKNCPVSSNSQFPPNQTNYTL